MVIHSRQHKISQLALSFFVIISMLIPAKELMLWCSIMDDDSSASHSMAMDHDMSSMPEDHCNSEESSTTDAKTSTHICDNLNDCDCLEIQSSLKDDAFLSLQAPITKIKLSSSVLKNLDQHHTNHEISPPPIWWYSSYSPPMLFLVNESFLI